MNKSFFKSISLFYWLLISAVLFGCKGDDISDKMYKELLNSYMQDPEYKAVQTTAELKLNEWIGKGLEEVQFLRQCKWKLDEAVFFNSERNRCYLLLLIQDDLADAHLDYIYQMYAVKENKVWVIYFAGLPNMVFPRARFGNKPISLGKLSELGCAEMLKGYLDRNGDPKDDFVNKAYTDDLKSKQNRFLNQQ